MSNEVTIHVRTVQSGSFRPIREQAERELGNAGSSAGERFSARARQRIRERLTPDLEREGERGGNRFASGITGAMSRQFSRTFGQVAESASTLFNRAFGTGVTSNPYLGAALVAAVAAAMAVALPIIGSTIAGGLTLAVGAGVAGIGLKFAAMSEQVKTRWAKTAESLKAQMIEISRPFETTLLHWANTAETSFGRIKGSLREAFADMAPAATQFGDDLMNALVPMLNTLLPKISKAFTAVTGALGDRLPEMLDQIGDSLGRVFDTIADNPDTFAGIVDGVIDVVTGLIDFVAWLSKVANWFQEHPEVTGPLITALKYLFVPFYGLIQTIKRFKAAWEAVKRLTAVLEAKTEAFRAGVASAIRTGLGFAKMVFRAGIAFGDRFRAVHAAAFRLGMNFARMVFRAMLTGDWSGVRRAVDNAIAAGRSWAGRTFTATFNAIRSVIPGLEHGGIVGGSFVDRAASGGPRGNWTMVGEHGPELVKLAPGSQVHSNPDTASMLGRGGGDGAGATLIIDSAGSRLDDLLLEILRRAIRARGGNVQLVLGKGAA